MSTTQTVSTRFLKYTDILVAAGVLGMVVMMIVPLPKPLLDFLLTINITTAIVILLVSMYNTEPLQFSVFPTMLLITTLFRLALNISATRLILLEADAGNIIETFGQFVLGGNAVVGFVIFLILIIIQFIVITRGAERVSEVSARFTLDAMPGKQMAIDADLNSGMITDEEARKRRTNIQREADFYGAMDGASKFVKGDAVAAIIIVVINIIGGFAIGMLMHGMAATEALSKYTILTVGEGLVGQIPALLISTATGITVTRAAAESNFGQDLTLQILNNPRVLAIASGALAIMALLGLPPVPFLTLAIILGLISFIMFRTRQQLDEKSAVAEKEQEIEEIRKPENVVALLQVDTLEMELGYSLIPLVDNQQGGDLLDRIVMIRRQFALEMGFILPPIRIRDNMQLKPNAYNIKIKGVEIASGELMPDHFLAMVSQGDIDALPGIDTVEPAFGLPAKWITANMREKAEMLGSTVVDPSSVVATHITEIARAHAHEIMTRQDVQTLLDNLKKTYPAVVEEVFPNLLSLGEIQKVLSNLLRERVPMRDLGTIMEVLGDQARISKDTDMLTEYVRQALSRHIVSNYLGPGKTLRVITLDPSLEQEIKDSLQSTEQGSYVALDPQTAQDLYLKLSQTVEKVAGQGIQPIVLCGPVVRFYFKKLTEKILPQLVVLSYNELAGDLQVEPVGVVSLA